MVAACVKMDSPTARAVKPPSGASSTTKMISSIDADSSAPRGHSPCMYAGGLRQESVYRDLRVLRGAIQHREEIQADQVHDPLLLQARPLAPKLPAQHAGRGQLGREAAPDRRIAPGERFPGKEVAGFPGRDHGARPRERCFDFMNGFAPKRRMAARPQWKNALPCTPP